jgi:ubiquinone/menaquinone biosynthesis C-methylase UbiE
VFAEPSFDVTGVDPDDASIVMGNSVSESLKKKPKLVHLESDALPFNDKSFDLVTSKSVLERVVNKPKYLEEALRILKTRGSFYIAYNCNKWFYLEYHSL